MKKIIPIIAVLAVLSFSFSATAQLKEGAKHVQNLCGCFDVQFKYAETFAFVRDYQFHDREEMRATELALPIEVSDKKIVIQHLLVMKDTMVIKHWREDWVYEQPYIWKYEGNKRWTKQALKPEQYKGRWTQTVWEVDDAPRYQGISEWVNTDNKTFWLNTTDAPLPRREYSTRNDYNILRRGNKLLLTPTGYVHEQDNDKVLLKDGEEKLIAQEKGLNIYNKLSDDKCAAAKAWWEKNGAFWSYVRMAWDAALKNGTVINLQEKVDGKALHQHLAQLQKEFEAKNVASTEVTAKASTILKRFIAETNDVATAQ